MFEVGDKVKLTKKHIKDCPQSGVYSFYDTDELFVIKELGSRGVLLEHVESGKTRWTTDDYIRKVGEIEVGDTVRLKVDYPDAGYTTDDLFTVRRVGGHVLTLKHVESGEPVFTTFDDVQKVVSSISGEELKWENLKVSTVSTVQIEIVDVSKLRRAIDFLQVGWGESDIERVLKLAKELV